MVQARRESRPPHPGEYVQEILEGEGISQEELAKHLGVERKTIHNLVNEKSDLSTEMAFRLARYTKTSAEVWMRLQMAVDIYDLKESERMSSVSKIRPSQKALALSA